MPGRAFAALVILATVALGAGCKRPSPLPPNVRRLIDDLKSPDLRRRSNAAVALEKVHPLQPEAIKALAEAVKNEEAVQSKDPSDGFQSLALSALSAAGAPAIPTIAALAGSRNPLTSERAAVDLGLIGMEDPAAWPVLIGAFKGDFSRERAALELARYGPPVVPLLRKALKDHDPRMRAGAAQAFAYIGENYRNWKDSGARMLKLVRIVLVSPTDRAPAIPELAAALKDPDANVRHQAAIALAYVAPNERRAVPVLLEIVEGKDAKLRAAAFHALDNMGTGAKDAVPALERMLAGSPVPLTRLLAARALRLSAGAAACGALAQAAADDKDPDVRTSAIDAMAQLWPACPQALPALIRTLGRKQLWAIFWLAKLGKPAVPALSGALKSPDSDVRKDAVEALVRMKPLSREAVPALMLALNDKSLDVRSAAAGALQNAGGEAERAALVEQKREEEIRARQAALEARLYSKAELVATIPADQSHKSRLTLAYLLPIAPAGASAQDARFLVTLHTGEDRRERLAFWKKVGDEQYQRIKVTEPEGPDFAQQHFETPITFRAKVEVMGRPSFGPELFVDVPIAGARSRVDQVFAIDSDGLHPVEIESATNWYNSKLGPKESIQFLAHNSFGNDKLRFEFPIWNAGDPMCCPTAGRVVGTYKVVKQTQGGGAFAGGAYGTGQLVTGRSPEVTTWKIVVDTARREPMPSPVRPSRRLEGTPRPGDR